LTTPKNLLSSDFVVGHPWGIIDSWIHKINFKQRRELAKVLAFNLSADWLSFPHFSTISINLRKRILLDAAKKY